MELALFIKGFVIGFSIAAPVGPIGILCIQRTVSGGQVQGLIAGLGAASADAIYGCIAAFGLTFISNFLVAQSQWFRLIGGVFLCYLGLRTFFGKLQQQAVSAVTHSSFSAYGTTFFLTLTNPMTILFFAGIFAGLGIVSETVHYPSAALMVMGVFTGSATWWLLLSAGTAKLRNKIAEAKLAWVNKISGLIILAFGTGAVLSLVLR
jgi:threonine/homoserine/homoserine lactone efflux protein